ncbi:hypothetical protein BGZ76_008392 [Entomortierella beljakovae]|nr:hypothetical protein BGZ76_008392 [Entomortierella beljakovae]
MSSAATSSWRSTLTNVPPLTKTISTAMIVMTALDFALRFRDMAVVDYSDAEAPNNGAAPSFVNAEATLIPLVAMVPVSAPFRFWTFATASFFERNIIQFAINITVLLGSGKYLERAWGSRELFKFLSITSVGSMLALYFTCLFEYIARGNENLIYETKAYGLTAVLAGFLVGFKQLVPEHLVTLWGVFSVRVKTLPMLFISYMIIESLIARSQIHLMLAIYGMLISWVYSRFFKVQDGIHGDRSETFSFASFFPEAAQPPVKAISNVMFGILVRFRICSPIGAGYTLQQDLEIPHTSTLSLPTSQPASLRAEAERRRALALKALDMRLHAAAGNSANLPGLSQKTFLGPTPSAGAPINLSSLPKESTPTAESDVLFETKILDEEQDSNIEPGRETMNSNP